MEEKNKVKEFIKQEVVDITIESDEESDLKSKSVCVGTQTEVVKRKVSKTQKDPKIVYIETDDSSCSESSDESDSSTTTPVELIFADSATQTCIATEALVIIDSTSCSDSDGTEDEDDALPSDNNTKEANNLSSSNIRDSRKLPKDFVVHGSDPETESENHKTKMNPKTNRVVVDVDLIEASTSVPVQPALCQENEINEDIIELKKKQKRCEENKEQGNNNDERNQEPEEMQVAAPPLSGSQQSVSESAIQDNECHRVSTMILHSSIGKKNYCSSSDRPVLKSVKQFKEVKKNSQTRKNKEKTNGEAQKLLKQLQQVQKQQTQCQKKLLQQQKKQQKQLQQQKELLRKLQMELKSNTTEKVPKQQVKEKKQNLPSQKKGGRKEPTPSPHSHLPHTECVRKDSTIDSETSEFPTMYSEMVHGLDPEIVKEIVRDVKETLGSWKEHGGTRCSECGKDFQGDADIYSHLKHAYMCKKYGKDFVETYSAKSKLPKMHFKSNAALSNSEKAPAESSCMCSPAPAYLCVWCTKRFTTQHSLVGHIEMHVMQSSCKCTVCSENEHSKRPSDLITNEKNIKRKRVSL